MNTHHLICPHCSYSENPPNAKECEVCGTKLKISVPSSPAVRQQETTVIPEEVSAPPEPSRVPSVERLRSPSSPGGSRSGSTPKQEKLTTTNLQELSLRQKRTSSAKNKAIPFWYSAIFILLGLLIGLPIGSRVIRRERNENLETQQANADQDLELEFNERLADVSDVPRGIFWYASSVSFAPLRTPQITSAIAQAHPQFDIQYKEPPAFTNPGSNTSVAMLLDGAISFAGINRPLRDSEYEEARERGVTLQQIPFAIDGVVFFVHPYLPVDRLSMAQIRGMILGDITNWQQVGGPNLPVVPFVFDPQIAPSVLLLLFEKLEPEQLSDKTQYVRDSTDAVRKVSSTPGSIGYASAAIVASQRSVRPILLARGDSTDYVNPFTADRAINTEVFQNGDYPLMRRFFVAVRRDGTIDEQAGLAYTNILLSEEGQELVKQAGFVPIKNP